MCLEVTERTELDGVNSRCVLKLNYVRNDSVRAFYDRCMLFLIDEISLSLPVLAFERSNNIWRARRAAVHSFGWAVSDGSSVWLRLGGFIYSFIYFSSIIQDAPFLM